MSKHIIRSAGVLLALFLFPLIGFAETPGVNGYNTVPKVDGKIIPKQQNPGYSPPNVQEGKSREAKQKKKKIEKKKSSEKAISKDKTYDSIHKKREDVEAVLSNEASTGSDLKRAQKEVEEIKAYIEANKDKETASQIEDLKTTSRNYSEQIGALEEKVRLREEAQAFLEKAKNTVNPTELSKLTSYIYLEEGFFGLKDVFPKVVNALVQGIFFLTKVIYCLVVIILEQVFSANVYESLDSIVSFSASFFNRFMEEYQYFVYALALAGVAIHYVRTRRFSFRLFRFVLIWILALWLYQPTTSSLSFGSQEFKASYNLSRVIIAVDGVASDVTRMAIIGFDDLDTSNQAIGQTTSAENLKAVKEAIFNKLVYEPFLSLNFNTTDVPEEKVIELFETDGKREGVGKVLKANEKIEQLSWSSIGVKFLTALASLIKACVIGFALILIGLISIVFKYLSLIMIVALVLILFISMIPSFEQSLGNAGKKIIQFTFMGGLGLFFIRAFLFVNGLIEGAVGGMTKVYFWAAILQGLIWFVLWKLRPFVLTVFVQGTLSAQELAQKVQSNLENLSPSHLSLSGNPFSPSRFLNRSTSSEQTGGGEGTELAPLPNSNGGTLFRAGKNLFRQGLSRVQQGYDNLRYGVGDNLDKQLAQEKRADFKQRLLDKKEDLKDLARFPKLEGVRSKLHDLAGDENLPVQERFKERERSRLERNERKDQHRQKKVDFKQFRKQEEENDSSLPLVSKVENLLVRPQLRREFEKNRKDLPKDSPIVEDEVEIAKELFEKGEK